MAGERTVERAFVQALRVGGLVMHNEPAVVVARPGSGSGHADGLLPLHRFARVSFNARERCLHLGPLSNRCVFWSFFKRAQLAVLGYGRIEALKGGRPKGRRHLGDTQRNELNARADGIIVTPTLLKLLPLPVQRVIGSLSDTNQVLQALSSR